MKLNQNNIVRTAKITPKKIGQFVSVWKRDKEGITQPHEEIDSFNFYIIHCESGKDKGYFKFPKSVLIKQGIVSSSNIEGKRGFRVYPPWDSPINKQAIKTQRWQIGYFHFCDQYF